MFEKEAEVYLKAQCQKRKGEFIIKMPEVYIADIPQAFKDGAEFGYNKANEWHYMKDGDLPKETNEYYVYSKQIGIEVRKFFADVGYFECRKNIIIAWKEIVLPKEIE
jgi:hypothetical protein